MGVEIMLHTSLTSALDKDEWSASYSSYFIHSVHWRGGFMSPSAGLKTVKNSCPVG